MSVPVEPDRAGGRLDQAHHGARDGRFAAAALADQPQRLASPIEKLTPSTA